MKVWKTHYSIVDQFGNAFRLTTTLNAGYGSKYCTMPWVFLNNEMDDFSAKAGVPMFGLGNEAKLLPKREC
jgi:gamma-glutamyltranspeptidase/glutathione hydrolase